MEKQKLRLVADPTFDVEVGIPRAGKDPLPTNFTFRHRTRDEFVAFAEDAKAKNLPDVDYILAVCTAWGVVDADDKPVPFTRESVETFTQNYQRAGVAISLAYARELVEAKLEN